MSICSWFRGLARTPPSYPAPLTVSAYGSDGNLYVTKTWTDAAGQHWTRTGGGQSASGSGMPPVLDLGTMSGSDSLYVPTDAELAAKGLTRTQWNAQHGH